MVPFNQILYQRPRRFPPTQSIHIDIQSQPRYQRPRRFTSERIPFTRRPSVRDDSSSLNVRDNPFELDVRDDSFTRPDLSCLLQPICIDNASVRDALHLTSQTTPFDTFRDQVPPQSSMQSIGHSPSPVSANAHSSRPDATFSLRPFFYAHDLLEMYSDSSTSSNDNLSQSYHYDNHIINQPPYVFLSSFTMPASETLYI
ncbi:hypothetical protein VKT23_009684 [Stygiomarasmius scandens]|uniref:Uncharacterized protein n=1 Tax=Marasmiellus scandens TaxID=2682957 RepID=A0ABR1JIC2_9AGAR